MAHSIDHLIEETPKGSKVELERLYMYPEGNGFLYFKDGTDWPFEDEAQLIQLLAGGLLRPMRKRAQHPERVQATA